MLSSTPMQRAQALYPRPNAPTKKLSRRALELELMATQLTLRELCIFEAACAHLTRVAGIEDAHTITFTNAKASYSFGLNAGSDPDDMASYYGADGLLK